MKTKENKTKAKSKKVAITDLKPRKAAAVKGGITNVRANATAISGR